MRVFATEDEFSENIEAEVGQFGHYDFKINWIEEGYVVINGPGGKGVDLFFALPKEDASGHVVFLDQRKRTARAFGVKGVNNLLRHAWMVPENLGNCSVIVGLFSCFSSSDIDPNDLIEDSFVVTYEQANMYHGTFHTHPISYPCVNVNRDPKTYLMMLFDGSPDRRSLCAQEIIRSRRKRKLRNADKLNVIVKRSKCQVPDEAWERIIFC